MHIYNEEDRVENKQMQTIKFSEKKFNKFINIISLML